MDRFPLLSRYWPFAVALGLAIGHRQNKRDLREVKKTGGELGTLVGTRWKQTDDDTRAMLDLTRQMVRLTWAVVVLTIVVLAATIWLGLR